MKKSKIGAAIAALALAAGLSLIGAQSASAHDKTASITCTTASVSLTNYDAKATAKVVVDGAVKTSGVFGGRYVNTFALTGNKEHTLTVDVISKDGAQFDYHFSETTTGCYVDTTPTTVVVPNLDVALPTCDADGYLPFTSNPAAQNPNGYEFPGKGYRVYLDRTYAGPGTYTATAQKVGPGFDAAFPNGTKVTGNTSQILTVLPKISAQSSDKAAPCYVAPPKPEQPADKVTVIVNEKPVVCDTTTGKGTVEIVTTTTTIASVYDEESNTWKDGEPVSVDTTTTRDATADECVITTPPTEPPTTEPTPPTTQPTPPVVTEPTPPVVTPVPPVVKPVPVVEKPAPVKHVAAPIVTKPTPTATTAVAQEKGLAYTGSNTGGALWWAGSLLGAGVAFIALQLLLQGMRRKHDQ